MNSVKNQLTKGDLLKAIRKDSCSMGAVKKNRNIVLLVLLLLTLSCNSRLKQTQVFNYYPIGTMILFPNNTYELHKYRGATRESRGDWIKRSDTIIFNSEYDPYSIKKTTVEYSKEDTSKYYILRLKLFSTNRVPGVSTIFLSSSNCFNDTLIIFMSDREHKVLKSSSFDILQVELCHSRACAYSQRLDYIKSDTITIYVDYPIGYYSYRYFKDEKAIIKKNKLIPID